MSPQEIANGAPLDSAPLNRMLRPTRPFYWSVRREIWENRAIYVAPLAVAGVVLLGMLVGALHLPADAVHMIAKLDPARQAKAMVIPYDLAAFAILVTSFIVAVFYSLGALQNERRDRSILFWKSLPVSDLTTVMSKARVPLVLLPLVTFAVTLATLLVILAISMIILPARGLPTMMLIGAFPLGRTMLDLAYTLVVLALWHAPIWGWLMLVSGWARRAAFLWAFGPPLALSIFERLAFNTSYVWSLMHYRVSGALSEAFDIKSSHDGMGQLDLQQIDPLKFMFTPGLWLGLAVAAALFAAAVWQRRYRTPI
jgi:ABC-2 type transport system permease protein